METIEKYLFNENLKLLKTKLWGWHVEVFDGLGANMNSKVEELEVVKTRLCERVVDVEGRRLIIYKELWRNLKKWPKNIGWDGFMRVMKTLGSFILL